MEINYQLTEDDYRQGLRAWQTRTATRRWSYRINLVLMGVLFVGSVILLTLVPDLRRVAWPGLGIVILWLVANFVAAPLQARAQFRRTPSAQGPLSATISDAGIQAQWRDGDSRVSWPTYIGWAEGKSVFVLFPQPRIYIPIPTRAFTDEQLSEFRETLRRNIIPAKK